MSALQSYTLSEEELQDPPDSLELFLFVLERLRDGSSHDRIYYELDNSRMVGGRRVSRQWTERLIERVLSEYDVEASADIEGEGYDVDGEDEESGSDEAQGDDL